MYCAGLTMEERPSEISPSAVELQPQGSTRETEDHHVDLPEVTVLELCIIPDIGGNSVPASLERMRVA